MDKKPQIKSTQTKGDSRALSSAAHTRLLKETLLFLGLKFRDFGRYFRNETGMALNPRTLEPFKYGVVGSADIYGITSVEITQDMIGKKIGVFTCYEVKTGNAVQSVEQKNYQNMIETHGGLYQVVRSVEDTLEGLDKWKKF